MKHYVTPILIDILLAIVLFVVIMGSFITVSCSRIPTIEKPPVAWQTQTTIEIDNTTTTAHISGSLEAGIIQSEIFVEFSMIDNIPLVFHEILNIRVFYSVPIQQSWTCDLVTEECELCIDAPMIWPSEICF